MADKPLNDRQDRFAVLIAEGQTPSAAYVSAGYSGSGSATTIAKEASRLQRHPGIAARIAEIRAPAAAAAGVTLAGHLDSLQAIRDKSMRDGKYAAAVSAEIGRGKASGVVIDRVKQEVTVETKEAGYLPGMLNCLSEWECDVAYAIQAKLGAERQRLESGGREMTRAEHAGAAGEPVFAPNSYPLAANTASYCPTCNRRPLSQTLETYLCSALLRRGEDVEAVSVSKAMDDPEECIYPGRRAVAD